MQLLVFLAFCAIYSECLHVAFPGNHQKGPTLGSVLVTGGAGFIGSHAAASLLERGWRVIVIDNLWRGHMENIVALEKLANGHNHNLGDSFRFYNIDLGDFDDVLSVMEQERPRAVMHFVGVAYAGESVDDPLMYYRNNKENTLNILNAMDKIGCQHIVFSSSCATYGSPNRQPITEDMPQEPISPHGWSKLIGERMILDWAKVHPVNAALLRYFNVIGADPEGRFGERPSQWTPGGHMYRKTVRLSTALFDAADGLVSNFVVAGHDYATHDGTAERDYIHVSDLVQAHIMVLHKLLTSGKSNHHVCIYNVGTGQSYSVLEMVAAAEKATGVNINVQFTIGRPGDPPVVTSDSSRLQRDVGWWPQYLNLTETLGHQWAFRSRIKSTLEFSSSSRVTHVSSRVIRKYTVADESGMAIGQMGPQLPNWHSIGMDLNFKFKGYNVAAKEGHNRFALAFTGCGVDYCQQVMSAIKTAVAQMVLDSARGDRKSYDIYVVADKTCRDMFVSSMFAFSVHVPAVSSLTVIPLSDILAIDGSEVNAFKYCAPVRLYLPQILHTAVDRFLYIDADAMVASSLMPIVNIMERETEEALFLSEEVNKDLCYPCGWYAHHRQFVEEGSNGFNSGVLGVNVNRWMAKGVDSSVSAVLQQVREGLLQIPLGDQDVINLMGKTDHSLIFQMPGEFNVRRDSYVANRTPWILHGNRGVFAKGQVWHDLGAKLLHAAECVLADGLQPTDPTDLWEKAGLADAK